MLPHSFSHSDKNHPLRFQASIPNEAGKEDCFINIIFHLDYLNMVDMVLCAYPEEKILGMCCSVEGGEFTIGAISVREKFTFEHGRKLLEEIERQAKGRDIKTIRGVFVLPSKFTDEIPKLFRAYGYEVSPVGAFQISVLKDQNTIQKDI